ncbi:MAG: tetraacyldisaccharide 4'-kinase [Flavobacteriaceae bacterium]
MRNLLLPLAWFYGLILRVRHFLFDKQILTSKKFPVKTLGVGNLALGGTGKSVVVEYLLDHFQAVYTLAVLSRGYKRKTRGFVLASASASALSIGDEPFQFYKKYPKISVAVCERRVLGIKKLMASQTPPEIIILDDVMQHRWVAVELLLLTTTYNNLFSNDRLFPAGSLRDRRQEARRAQIILITKCPKTITKKEAKAIRKNIQCVPNQKVYFTTIDYNAMALSVRGTKSLSEILQHRFILITGIAVPTALVEFLEGIGGMFEWLKFPDHHVFSKVDIKKIESLEAPFILTTEKDYGRLYPCLPQAEIYYLPIRMGFVFKEEEESFKNALKSFFDS